MEAFGQSFALVVAAEMGDKTQLLALILALRFKKPAVVLAAILVATLLNHGLATLLGGWLSSWLSPQVLKTALSLVFLAFAAWILIPDKADDGQAALEKATGTSAFLTTLTLFFLAEMGDKTQLATIALGAKFHSVILVTAGTTLGMLVADGLAVVFGERLMTIVPMKSVRIFSAILFVAFAAAIYSA